MKKELAHKMNKEAKEFAFFVALKQKIREKKKEEGQFECQ